MPPSAVTAEAVAAAAVAADAAAAARDVTAAAHDELDTVAEEPAAVTTAAEPATEPPVAALASVTLDAAPTDLAAPPEPPATTAPTPFAALATPPPPPIDDDAPAIPRWAFLRVGRAMERSAVADADDEVSYLDVDLDPGAAPRARGFFAAAAPPPLADPAPPAPDGTPPGQGQGQLVVPGLPRGASAGSLAYSQTTTEGSYVDVHVSSPSSSSRGVSPRSQSSGRSEDI